MDLEISLSESLGIHLAQGRRCVRAGGGDAREIMRGGRVVAGTGGQRVIAEIAVIEGAAPSPEVGEIQRESAGCHRRVRDVFALVPRAIVEGTGEAGVVARDAAIEFQILIDLVREVQLEPLTPARGTGGVLTDIRIDDGLGLLPEIEDGEGERKIGAGRGA